MLSPLRIMPLGDSLTEFDCRLNAYTTADDKPIFQPLDTVPAVEPFAAGTFFVVAPGGYRGYLAELLGDPKQLPQDAIRLPPWSYVGRKFGCGSHEGYSGETIEWLADHVAAGAATAADPDIILLWAGTNDFFWPPPRGSRDPAQVAMRMRRLLNVTFAHSQPNVTLLLSTVTPIVDERCKYYSTAHWHPPNCPADMNGNIVAYNRLLPRIVAEYRSLGKDITLMQQPRFATSDYFTWGVRLEHNQTNHLAPPSRCCPPYMYSCSRLVLTLACNHLPAQVSISILRAFGRSPRAGMTC